MSSKKDDLEAKSELSRREFLAGLAAATGALMVGSCSDSSDSDSTDVEHLPLPDPETSGIEHIVVVMMENRSYDHFLGWLPGGDGLQSGLEYVDRRGVAHAPYPLAPEWQGCQYGDPDHSYNGGRIQFADGACDGWLRASTDDLFPIGYYRQEDLSFFGQAVPSWTTCDRYFCSLMGPTFPNRIYQHAGATDRLRNTLDPSDLPAIWDRIAEKGLSGRYYYNDLPVTALFGARFIDISKPYSEFLADAAAGRLPNLAFVDPRFVNEELGTSNDDHPFADIRNGQIFLNEIYEAIVSSPNWPNTVLVINYDEWGGFYDHVPPPLMPQTALDREIGNDGRLGFRVPLLVVSPLARRGFIGHEVYDHTSILRMVEWRWGLDPLAERDATAYNLAHVLDFQKGKDLRAPRFDVPQGPFGHECIHGEASRAARADVVELGQRARRYGFDVPW
ncbi:MAG TPA: alkaline phosphatase family protein [Candidatus Binatia bacterium]